MMNVFSMTVLIFLFNHDVHLNERMIFFYAIILTVYVNKFNGQRFFNPNNYFIDLNIIYLLQKTIRLDKISPALYIVAETFIIMNKIQSSRDHIHDK